MSAAISIRKPTVPSSVAYDDYARWAQGEIGWALKQLRFARTLTGRGFRRDKGTAGQRLIRGLRLKAPAPLALATRGAADHEGVAVVAHRRQISQSFSIFFH